MDLSESFSVRAYQNFKVFFYGMAQLFAHFICWYRDELLTHFDFSVCLDSNSISLIGC